MTQPSLIPVERRSLVHILVVEDEVALLELLRLSLERAGYHVTAADSGEKALEVFAGAAFDLVVLDILLPGMDGFAVCVELRKRSNVPIVMLTSLNRSDDIVRGFGLGADDYITKPFTFREVEVRIAAILRRIDWATARRHVQILSLGDVVLDDDLREVHVRGAAVHLTPIEYQLLRYLMRQPDRPAGKEELFANVWGYEMAGGTNLVEVAVHRLREKIEVEPSSPRQLVTVHGVGYKFCTPANGAAPNLTSKEPTSEMQHDPARAR